MTSTEPTTTSSLRTCRSCQQALPLEQFRQNDSRIPKGYYYRADCIPCRRAWLKDHDSVRNFDPVRRSYLTAASRRRRAVKRGLPHVAYDAQEIYDRDNGVCALCGFPVDPERYDIEHIVPLQVKAELLLLYGIDSHPGDTPWNVSLAHPSCNSTKLHYMSQEDAARYSLWSYLYKERHVPA